MNYVIGENNICFKNKCCFSDVKVGNSVVANFATTASDGKTYQVEHYNLDMIISVVYRVKSNRGVEFRKWANKILKQYIIQGYAINEKRLEALQRTVSIQTKMLASTLEVEEIEEMYQMLIVLLVTLHSMVKIRSRKHLMS